MNRLTKIGQTLRNVLTGSSTHEDVERFVKQIFGERAIISLHPLVRRHIFKTFPGAPEGIWLGWAQIQDPKHTGFTLGVFVNDHAILPIGIVDASGNVTLGETLNAAHSMEFHLERQTIIQDGQRCGQSQPCNVLQGSIVGRNESGTFTRVGTWLKHAKRYSIESMSMPLPESMRIALPYRDAMAIAFFAGVMIPQMLGLELGFGSTPIMRHLHMQAPISAIDSNMRTINQLRMHGMRVSGLEELYEQVMSDAGALDHNPNLSAVHGAEPLHAVWLTHSGMYRCLWDNPISYETALEALRIEGNVNRFVQVRQWLANNESQGLNLTENTATCAQCVEIDNALLENPALAITSAQQSTHIQNTSVDKYNAQAIVDLYTRIRQECAKNEVTGQYAIRQSLVQYIAQFQFPYRIDTDFRLNADCSLAALAFTQVGPALMPNKRYNAKTHEWQEQSEQERAYQSVQYNLRVGIVFAALMFAVAPQLEQLYLRINSIGLEEAVERQDSAIKRLMGEAIADFDQLQSGEHNDVPTTHEDTHESLFINDESFDAEFEQLLQQSSIETSTSSEDSVEQDNPMEELTAQANVTPLLEVTFERDHFLNFITQHGLHNPQQLYDDCFAQYNIDTDHGFTQINPEEDLYDEQFAPHNAQQPPEEHNKPLSDTLAQVLAAEDTFGIAIQRADLFASTNTTLHELATNNALESVEKARLAMQLIDRIHDPELSERASTITTALIDGNDTPDITSELARSLEQERSETRDLLFSGNVEQALEKAEQFIAQYDAIFTNADGVARYFNSYAERIVYNHLFATTDEKTILIPDNLFYAHLELADIITQMTPKESPLDHLNMLVSYAPAYPLSHLKLAAYYARIEDWDSVRAACYNALRVSLDPHDAGFAYYKLAQAAWMRDEFDIAAASYIMCTVLVPENQDTYSGEMNELMNRAASQSMQVPQTLTQAMRTLQLHNVPVWPHTPVAQIIQNAARASVDEGMFVPARTLVLAAARMHDTTNGIDITQVQFLRSLV